MLGLNVTVRPASDDQIRDFYKWLLGADPDSDPIPNGDVFYMRECLNYVDNIEDRGSAPPRRTNAGCDGDAHTDSATIASNISIVLPLVHTLVHNQNRARDGHFLSTVEQEDILDEENSSQKVQLKASIENLTDGTSDRNIDRFAQVSNIVRISNLNIPSNSALADKLEFAEQKNNTVNLRAKGYFLEISGLASGKEYRIQSDCGGVRGYEAKTDYHITIS
jgi:hypothetical protein